jgi:nucleotide-binding universal stress UspA family protein
MWSFPPRRILCPVDFGDASAAALRAAGVMAQQFGAELTVVHAESFDAPPYFTSEQIAQLEADRAAARLHAQDYLMRFAGIAAAPLRAVVVEGPASAAILAEAPACDLVVMGTHGRRGASRWWLGSVAERVVRDSPVPVLVIRAGRAEGGAALFGRIATVGDADPTGTGYAAGLARAFGGSTVEASSLATLVVASRPGGSAGAAALERVAAYVRASEHPVLFVPVEAAAAA